uniref:Uncharacterized protein n=1 Tax=Trichobilharzia regenti TaxID=157069 RepID=A0AA85KR55_TRIRE|nr:unnamed protein product [Trichobilharzia regenti]
MSAPIKFYLLIIISIHLNTGLSINQNDLNFAANFTKPKIIHSPSDVFSTDGVLEFTCQASGYPKPQVVWYDADTGQQVIDRVPSSGTTSGIHVNQHYGKLLISSPERGKLYSFYCNASNSAGWVISQPPVRGGSAYISSQFQQIPVEKTVHEGDRVVMECSPPLGIPEVKVYWLKNKHLFAAQIGVQPKNNYSVITDTNSNTEISPDGSLQISSVTIRDTGTYTCVASNLAGEQISPSAYLLVKTRTRFLETPVDVRVKKGRDVKLRCRVEGNQVVKWKRGHGEDPIDPNRAELTENYLLIKNIQVSDAGTYICTAPGGVEADAIVTVDSPPAFSVTPDDLTVNEGEIAVFHCVATGYPMPAIYWELPDKTPIFPGDQTVHEFHNGKHYLTPDGTLEVRDVKQSDSGKYQCTAHSSIDTIHTSAVLHVTGLVKKKLAPSKNTYSSPSENQEKHQPLSNFYWLAPIIGLPPANQTRRVGDIVTLHCELGMTKDFPGSLPPTSHYSELSDWSIGWYRSTKDGSVKEYMDSSSFSNDRRYTLLPGGSLQIIDVQEEDSGNYTCFAKAVIKPYTDDHLTSFTLQSNWTSHLNIVPLGSMVSNSIGSENPLPQPRNLRATNVTASTVILVWEPSLPPIHSQEFSKGYSPQITYWVELYRPDRPADGWVVVEQNWHAHTVQLGGLQPDTAYYFLIRPRWDQGRVGWASAPLGPILTLKEKTVMPESGELSDAEYFQSVKDINLLGLHLYPLSTKRVRVSWSITEIPQVLSKVTGYSIYSKEVPLMQCISTKFDPTYSETVEVATRNKGDMYCSLQPNSPTDSYSLYKKLENMQNLYTTNQNSTANSWTVNDIKARYPKNEKYSEIQHPVTYQESGLLRDLEAFRCYSVKVKAYSLNSIMGRIESSESNSVTVLTYESFPSSPPERIFAVWLSNTTIELSWEPPHVNSWNGLLTGYIIYVYDEDASNHKSFNLSYTEQKTLIKGLTGKTTYFLQMAAVTCKGIGVRSVPIQLRPNLRKKGLGVGWGFDLQTGKLLQFMNLDKKMTTNPMILLVWCATVALITFCCRHQRYRFRKSAGNVHVTPNSQRGLVTDGSNNIFSSTNNPGTESKCSKNSHPSKKDQVQMEPLLRPESPTNENDNSFESMETGKYPGWRPYPSNTQNQSHYSINTNNRDSGSRILS